MEEAQLKNQGNKRFTRRPEYKGVIYSEKWALIRIKFNIIFLVYFFIVNIN